uniref:60S ribosomal protein L13a n=1 Tax=Ascaris lumbricoides TaxID=6252 RepID=A0A0M3HN65_ASCLU
MQDDARITDAPLVPPVGIKRVKNAYWGYRKLGVQIKWCSRAVTASSAPGRVARSGFARLDNVAASANRMKLV